MSAATKQALDAAVESHLADEGEGALLNGYVLFAHGGTLEDHMNGSGRSVVVTAPRQNSYTTAGYVRRLALRFDRLFAAMDRDPT